MTMPGFEAGDTAAVASGNPFITTGCRAWVCAIGRQVVAGL